MTGSSRAPTSQRGTEVLRASWVADGHMARVMHLKTTLGRADVDGLGKGPWMGQGWIQEADSPHPITKYALPAFQGGPSCPTGARPQPRPPYCTLEVLPLLQTLCLVPLPPNSSRLTVAVREPYKMPM